MSRAWRSSGRWARSAWDARWAARTCRRNRAGSPRATRGGDRQEGGASETKPQGDAMHGAERTAIGVGVVERAAVVAELAHEPGAGRELHRVRAHVVPAPERERVLERPLDARLHELLVVGRLRHL